MLEKGESGGRVKCGTGLTWADSKQRVVRSHSERLAHQIRIRAPKVVSAVPDVTREPSPDASAQERDRIAGGDQEGKYASSAGAIGVQGVENRRTRITSSAFKGELEPD